MAALPAESNVAPGDVLAGKYLVTRVLGRGGMGVVVEARHAELGEKFAIKVLHQRYLENAEALARFHHEARAAVRIRGEHSARLIDVGTTGGGAPFIVMELLEGSDLASVLKMGPVSLQESVLYILQACEGMAEVHANGIVHRDLKPGNLFLTRRLDGRPLVKVLDFGIAKSALPMSEDERAVTMTLVSLGTPLYMSPEQVRCSKAVDARTDIWSLGAILYELILGRPAFGGNSVSNITAQVLEATPAPLTSRAGVPPELDKVVQTALAKKPEKRFVDVAAFALALAPFAGELGREHAERAARILRGEGRGLGATPFGAPAGAIPGGTTLMETEVLSAEHFGRRRRSRVLTGLAVALAILAVVIGRSVATAYQASVPGVAAPAAKGFHAASAVRGAVVVTAARLAATATPVASAEPAATAAPTSTPVAAPRGKGGRAAPTPPPAGRAAPTAKPADLLSTRR